MLGCNECNYKTKIKRDLLEHQRVIHKETKFVCKECGHQTSYKQALTQHIRALHEGLKYLCDLCDNQARIPAFVSTLRAYMKRGNINVAYVNIKQKQKDA